jgi:hypothetical protein
MHALSQPWPPPFLVVPTQTELNQTHMPRLTGPVLALLYLLLCLLLLVLAAGRRVAPLSKQQGGLHCKDTARVAWA